VEVKYKTARSGQQESKRKQKAQMFPLHLNNQIRDPCFRQTKLSCLSFLFCFFQTLSHFNINHYIKEPCKNRTKILKKILILALTVIALLFLSHSKKLFPIHQFLDFRFFYLRLFTLFIHLMCFINFYGIDELIWLLFVIYVVEFLLLLLFIMIEILV